MNIWNAFFQFIPEERNANACFPNEFDERQRKRIKDRCATNARSGENR